MRFYCAEVVVGHWEFPEVTRRAKDLKAKYGVLIVVEEVPWSKPLIQTLQEQTGCIPWLRRWQEQGEPGAAVVDKAERCCATCRSRRRGCRTSSRSTRALLNAAHDADQVDTTVMALMYLSHSRPEKPMRLAGGYRIMGR